MSHVPSPAPGAGSESDEELAELLGRVAHAPVYEAQVDDEGRTRLTSGVPLPVAGDVVDGKYLIDAVLGKGGMGVVYAATQLNTGREVALKWMHRERLGHTPAERVRGAQRFVREARIAARITHPHCVQIHDVGGDPAAPYLVMERLHGETLRDYIERRGPVSWNEATTLLAPVLDVMQHAHDAGVLHRDLKPDNIFLARQRDGSTCPKVLDFGIARLASGDDEEGTLTHTGSVLGTPAYMPLEQLRGERGLDARADVFALGVVLYELLSGERPYQARNAADYAAQLASGSPVPLGTRRPELRGRRERAVAQALRRDAADRYASVEAMREALVEAQKVGRARLAVTFASVVGVVVLGWMWWTSPDAEQDDLTTVPASAPPHEAPVPTRSAATENASRANSEVSAASTSRSPPSGIAESERPYTSTTAIRVAPRPEPGPSMSPTGAAQRFPRQPHRATRAAEVANMDVVAPTPPPNATQSGAVETSTSARLPISPEDLDFSHFTTTKGQPASRRKTADPPGVADPALNPDEF